MPHTLVPGVRPDWSQTNRYQHLGFVALRRPLNSFTKLSEFHQRLTSANFEESLKKELSCNFLQEGIRIASGDLYEKLRRWLGGEKMSGNDELVRTLYKYFIRSCTRCTPFGLFAGLAYGEISDKTEFKFASNTRPELKAVPDFTWQRRVFSIFTEDVKVRAGLSIKVNSSLVELGGNFRYIERLGESFYLNTFAGEETLRVVLELASGNIKYAQLIDQLVETGHSRSEVIPFIDELLVNDVLEFAERPTVIGRAFPEKVVESTLDVHWVPNLFSSLQGVQALCQNQDSDLSRIGKLRDSMVCLDSNRSGNSPFKVDSFFDFEKATISERFVQSAMDALSDLSVLDFHLERQDLKSFKDSFLFKYDTQEVPLWLALDAQLGIGFEGDLSGLAQSGEESTGRRFAEAQPIESSNLCWQRYLSSKYLRNGSARLKEVELTKADLAEIANLKSKNPSLTLATSAYAFGAIAECSSTESAGNWQFVLRACQGPTAINMLSRFANGSSELADQVSKIVAHEQEQRPDAILAEVVYSPDAKVANVMSRPTLYNYEIEYLGNASVAQENVIHISDLMVSVREGKLLLRSKRLNRRVIPRLSNMHNHHFGPPVYRFLTAMQSQDSSFNIAWDWDVLSNSDSLPRVRYKNIIISRATWKIRRGDFLELNNRNLLTRLDALGVPGQFLVVVGDNELFIDALVNESVDLLRVHISKNEVSVIKELMHVPERSLLKKGGESFNSEFVIPFAIRKNLADSKTIGLSRIDVSKVTEQFEPGGEWVYFKVYASEGMLDLLIREKIARFARELIKSGGIEKFFFVRYLDPNSHLRLRFLLGKNSTLDGIVATFRELLTFELHHKLVSRIQLDTYQRELDRYGRDRIELCESHFSEDSLSISEFLENGDCVRTIPERLYYALDNVIKVLEIAAIETATLPEFCEDIRNKLLSDLNIPLSELTSWRELTRTLILKKQRVPDLGSTENIRTPGRIFEGLDAAERSDMLVNLVHMSVNRLFQNKQRYYEAVVYHLVYKSLLAKTKYNRLLHGSC